jgi:hypothetical protein
MVIEGVYGGFCYSGWGSGVVNFCKEMVGDGVVDDWGAVVPIFDCFIILEMLYWWGCYN